MHVNRGYELYDAAIYLNQFSEIQIAGVWHQMEQQYKVEMPDTFLSISERLAYEELMVPF